MRTLTHGNIVAEGDAHVAGEFVALMPHGTFLSLETQQIVNVTLAQAVTFNSNDDVERLTHDVGASDSKVYAQEAGSYEIIASGIYNDDAAAGVVDEHIDLWLCKNGVNVANSNTTVHIGNAKAEATLAVSFIFDLAVGEYVELMTSGTSTDLQWLYTAAGVTPARPAVPSVIMSMKKISAYPA